MLKDIKGTILKEAKGEGESALRKAEEQIEADLAKVKAEGEAKVAAAEQEARAVVENERRERLSWAKLEAKRVVSEAKEDAVKGAFESLVSRVEAYCGTRDYAERMKARISAALGEIGSRAIVHVRRGEKMQIPGADVRKDAQIMGGAIVESRDGRLRIDSSLEALLDAERDSIRKAIYEIMFK